MNTAEERIALLNTLHELSRTSCHIDLGVLAGRLGWGVGRVARVLGALQGKGLADRASCRLTMSGLAIAVTLAAARALSHQAA
ncbi:MAG TPA: hypothetical protein ENK57_16215 [Polyangiaceae bacterium]|nr:hypothetical protein [Polyangiaceae bacterium]